MTDGITLSGASMLAGRRAAVMIAGLDAGTYTIGTDGSLFVPFGSDPDGLLTPTYLNQVSNPASTNPALMTFNIVNSNNSQTITVSVPVVIGYAYTSSGQKLRPLSEGDTKTPAGPSLGKTRRLHWWSGLFQSTQGLSIGTGFSTLDRVFFEDNAENTLTYDTLFTGVMSKPLTDSYSFDGQLAWQVTRPYACTIVSLEAYLETQER